MKNKILLLMLFCLLVFVFPFVSGSTITVPGNFSTIQAAINNASDGNVIMVGAGTYNESQIIINKSISVIGEGADNTTINGGSANLTLTGTGLVRITANGNVTFKGFNLINAGGPDVSGGDGGDNKLNVGVYAQSSNSSATYTISNNKIVGTNNPSDEEDYGIYSNSGEEKLIFTNNIITKTGANSILIETHPGQTEISFNTLDAGCYGIDSIFYMTYGSKDITKLQNVSHNTIDIGTGGTDKATAISFMSSFTHGTDDMGDGKYSNIQITYNTINNLKDNKRGISLYNDAYSDGKDGEIKNSIIKGNKIYGTVGSASNFGIRLVGYVTGTTVSYNYIENCGQSFYGTVGRHAAGIYPTGTKINYNSFIGNSQGLVWDGTELLNATYNYWGSCNGPGLVGLGNGDNVSTNVNYTPWLGICSKDETNLPSCSAKNQDIKLYSNLSGVCINEVIFSAKLNGVWKNFTGSPSIAPKDIEKGNYYALINSNFTNSENVEWKVYTKDCYNNTYNDSSQSFYIYPSTTLTIAPLEPNGNGWYLVNPIFNLTNPNASKIYYKWDNLETWLYSTPFGFENAANNQNITGGIIDLSYWSNFSCGNETVQSKIIKVDLAAPEIINLAPSDNSTTHETKPQISVYLRDKYNGDSGINSSSIIFKLDGVEKKNYSLPESPPSSLNFNLEYYPDTELSNGYHNVSINVSDYAGRNTEVSWRFDVEKINNSFDLKFYSLFNEIYSSTRIQLNFTTTKKVNFIEYIDRSTSASNRWIKLCYNCNNYGFSVLKYATFPDGQHNLTIRASNEFETHEKNMSFIVDSKAPQIQKTEPGTNQFTNGSNFYIRFSEDNPSTLTLFVNNSLNKYTIDLSKCTKVGKYTDCYYNIDDVELTPFEGKTIPYWFELKDIANHTSSTRKIVVKVDTQNPYMDVISPQDDTTYAKKVPFSIFVNETNLNSVSYTYTYNGREKEILLCSKLDKYGICKITKSFTPGNYTIVIKAEDKAGNVKEKPVAFEVK